MFDISKNTTFIRTIKPVKPKRGYRVGDKINLMSGFPILDLVVGIIFIYFLLSIICSSAVELWFTMRNTRARLLEQWVKKIFDLQALDSAGVPKIAGGKPVTVGQEIMDHCMITALSAKGRSTSYYNAKDFVSALLDKITLEPAKVATTKAQDIPQNLNEYITKIQNSPSISGELRRTILGFAYQAKMSAGALEAATLENRVTATITTTIKSDFDLFREKLENWYDANSDRITGTLKRTKVIPSTVVVATLVTIFLNTDSVTISKYLYTNKDAATQLATTAMNTYNNYNDRVAELRKADTGKNMVSDTSFKSLEKTTTQLRNDVDSLRSLSLPMGWDKTGVTDMKSFWGYFFQWKHIGGWLATILAICMGAPFWFDLLNKIANLRGTGPKPAPANIETKK